MQINGVGRVTAEAIVAYLDDPHRFKNANQVGAYAGLFRASTSRETPTGVAGLPSVDRGCCERYWWSVPGARFNTTIGAVERTIGSTAEHSQKKESGRRTGEKDPDRRLGADARPERLRSRQAQGTGRHNHYENYPNNLYRNKTSDLLKESDNQTRTT